MFSALTDKNRSRPWRFVGTVVVGTVGGGAVVVVGAVLGLGCLCSDLIQVTRGVQVGGCEKCAGKDSRKRGQCDLFVVDAFFLVCAFIPFFSVLLFVFVSLEAFSSPVAPFVESVVESVVSCLYLHRFPKLQFPEGKFRHSCCCGLALGLFMTATATACRVLQ